MVREAQQHANWVDGLMRGVGGEGLRGMSRPTFCGLVLRLGLMWIGYGPLIREYVFFIESKLSFHRNHPEFNGMLSFSSS